MKKTRIESINISISNLIIALLCLMPILFGETPQNPEINSDSLPFSPKDSIAAPVWVAPAEFSKVENPLPPDEKSIKTGEKIFKTNCVICHGESGKGDGLAAAALGGKVRNLTQQQVWQQSDGALHWKITSGHNPMPPFKGIINDNDLWHLINYLRTTFQEHEVHENQKQIVPDNKPEIIKEKKQ